MPEKRNPVETFVRWLMFFLVVPPILFIGLVYFDRYFPRWNKTDPVAIKPPKP